MITGEQIRTRSLARPIAAATCSESSSPYPGVNQARAGTPSTDVHSGSTKPLCSTLPLDHSCSKSAANARASAPEEIRKITFSWRVHESSVQFVEPLHT